LTERNSKQDIIKQQTYSQYEYLLCFNARWKTSKPSWRKGSARQQCVYESNLR